MRSLFVLLFLLTLAATASAQGISSINDSTLIRTEIIDLKKLESGPIDTVLLLILVTREEKSGMILWKKNDNCYTRKLTTNEEGTRFYVGKLKKQAKKCPDFEQAVQAALTTKSKKELGVDDAKIAYYYNLQLSINGKITHCILYYGHQLVNAAFMPITKEFNTY